MRSAVFWILTFFLNIAWPAYAEFTWDRRSVELNPTPQETKGRAQFRFTNSGETPVTVKAVKKSCGCTAANTQLKNYQPGESGVLDVVIDFGQRVGPQEWVVSLETDDPADPTSSVRLNANLVPPIQVTPSFLLWTVGDSPVPQSFTVTAIREKPIHLADVTSTDPRFVTQLTVVKEGEEYQIMVTPQDLNTPANGIIRMAAYLPKGSPHFLQGYVLIKPAQHHDSKIPSS